MATSLRAYSQWPDDSGELMTARGCLLPAKYNFSGIPGFDWICPVRSCRICFPTQTSLGPHFTAAHHSCLLNDNRDGTFTIIGKYKNDQKGKTRPALVRSQNPLTKDTPPMMEPQPPAGRTKIMQRKRFAASLKKARLAAAPDSSETITVDEMMLQTGFFDLSPAPELSELSRTPSFEESPYSSKPHASISNNSTTRGDAMSDGESTTNSPEYMQGRQEDASNTLRDDTKENWRLIRKFLTGRQFYPPKRGHFSALLSTPRSRDIILRAGVRFVADQPKKVRILMVHMTGQESPMPCNSCDQGRGPFKKCVAINKAAAGETTNGIVCCTNCATKKVSPHGCNVEDLLSRPAAGTERMRRKAGPTSETREHSNLSEAGSGVTSVEATASRVTKVDSHFTFRFYSLPVDGSLGFDADPLSLRLCSVAEGKVMVQMGGNMPFLIGTHGMFKLGPEVSAQVMNASDEQAVLHVSAVKV